jgi:hypothetical protein
MKTDRPAEHLAINFFLSAAREGLVLVVEFGILGAIVESSCFLEGRTRSSGGAMQKSTIWRQLLQGNQRVRSKPISAFPRT